MKLAFWFATAPDLRFSWAYFAMLITLAIFYLARLSQDFSGLPPLVMKAQIAWALALAMLLICAPLVAFTGTEDVDVGEPLSRDVAGLGLVYFAYPTGQCWQLFPCSDMSKKVRVERIDGRLWFYRPIQ